MQTAGTSSIPGAAIRLTSDRGRFPADIATLKQALFALVEHLRQSGVGALPLEAPPVPDPRSDEQLIAEATKAVQGLYERQKRIQDGAGIVAGLLGQAVPGAGAGAGGESQGAQAAERRGLGGQT